MAENNSKAGCTIAFIVGVIAAIAIGVGVTSAESFAEMGSMIMFVVSGAIVYFIYKLFSNGASVKDIDMSDNKGCLKAILIVVALFVLLGLIYSAIGSNFEFNMGLGILVFVVIAIAIAVLLWNSLNK